MLLERLIGPNEDGKELKTVLKYELKLSNTMIARLKTHQGIFANGKPVFTNYICHQGDHITLDLDAAEPPQCISPEHGDLSILYEDDYVLAVYKPEGMLTHPSRTQFDGTLMGFVLGHLSQSGILTCHSMNRLDRYTSGIVLFSKNAYAKALFANSMQNAQKDYIAVTYGRVAGNSGVIDLPIDRLQSGNILRGVSQNGAKAITHYQLLDVITHDGIILSVLRLKPETGRTHQLRVHCLALGHPIIGDQIYCTEKSKAFSDRFEIRGQLLHAERLQFIHPVSKNEIVIHCQIRRDPMQRLLAKANITCI